MKKRTLWIGLIILSLVLSGCGKPKFEVKYATLSGQIIDATEGARAPIVGATVKIDGQVMSMTDGSGWFQTGRFKIGVRELEFSAEGYSSVSLRVNFTEAGDFWLLTDEYEPGQIPLGRGLIGPRKVYDLPVVFGTGEVTIDAQYKIDRLLLIPYNTSMTPGTSFAELTVEQDGIQTQKYLLNSMPLTKSMATGGEDETEAFYERLREKEREVIQAQLGQVDPFGVSRDIRFGTQASDPPSQEVFYKVIGNDYEVKVNATRIDKDKSDFTYIYLDDEVDEEFENMLQYYIEDLEQTFNGYYEKLERAFGPPPAYTDIDGYPGIFYLLTELDHYSDGPYVAGYFYGGNQFPKEDIPYSNEKEVLFLTTYRNPEATFKDWLENTKSTMAHELQHLINFTNRYMKIDSYDQLDQYATETWINEGLSMVAEDLVMDWNNPLLDGERVIPYLMNPAADSLCTWGGEWADYAPAYMFMRYFVDRFGTDKIKELLHSDQFGLDSVVSVSGESSFAPLFRGWLTAVYIRCHPEVKADFADYDHYKKDLSNIVDENKEKVSLAVEPFSNDISIPDTTGQFIELDGFSSTKKIRIVINGSSYFKLRALMFPVAGEPSFKSLQFQLQRVR
ncbi:MAG TPA: hypothetical protein DD789_06590 [Firmicutes bacterium]|jgi:hypothetical protein|nr:hypothetical protein [Bacillota bacterium]